MKRYLCALTAILAIGTSCTSTGEDYKTGPQYPPEFRQRGFRPEDMWEMERDPRYHFQNWDNSLRRERDPQFFHPEIKPLSEKK